MTEFVAILTLAIAIIGPVTLWFGLGSRIGKMEATLDGYRQLIDSQLKQLAKDRADCETRERKEMLDHEQRLRSLERGP